MALDFDTPHPEARIALELVDSGIRREALPYIAFKLREAGYCTPLMAETLPEAVKRMKADFPACWPQEDDQPRNAYHDWRQRVGQAMAARQGRA